MRPAWVWQRLCRVPWSLSPGSLTPSCAQAGPLALPISSDCWGLGNCSSLQGPGRVLLTADLSAQKGWPGAAPGFEEKWRGSGLPRTCWHTRALSWPGAVRHTRKGLGLSSVATAPLCGGHLHAQHLCLLPAPSGLALALSWRLSQPQCSALPPTRLILLSVQGCCPSPATGPHSTPPPRAQVTALALPRQEPEESELCCPCVLSTWPAHPPSAGRMSRAGAYLLEYRVSSGPLTWCPDSVSL